MSAFGLIWYAWLLLTLYAVAAVATILSIGKPRETRPPRTPGIALGVLVIYGLEAWAILELAT